MEFHEKLQELRKSKGLTQEELAADLNVSRTAISKWESGRGYPNIDSLKEIAKYFAVTIDELLTSEKVLSLAEKENASNIRNICDLLFGIVDVCFFLLILLPLYPNTVEGYIYSVNLLNYIEVTTWNRFLYWGMFVTLILCGILKITLGKFKVERGCKLLTDASIGLNILLVVFLAMTREAYAVTMAFLLLIIKGTLIFKKNK